MSTIGGEFSSADIGYFTSAAHNFRLIAENGTTEVIIDVKEENLWNLIEEDRTYFIVYSWKENELPKIDQIEINDDFKEIYGDQLNIEGR